MSGLQAVAVKYFPVETKTAFGSCDMMAHLEVEHLLV